jgi:hypothetical protein
VLIHFKKYKLGSNLDSFLNFAFILMIYEFNRIWAVRLKTRLEQNTPHQSGTEVTKPICDYMGRVANSLIAGEKKPPNPEAGETV